MIITHSCNLLANNVCDKAIFALCLPSNPCLRWVGCAFSGFASLNHVIKYLLLNIAHSHLILVPQALDVVLLAQNRLDSTVE